jgi:hypothetical protein
MRRAAQVASRGKIVSEYANTNLSRRPRRVDGKGYKREGHLLNSLVQDWIQWHDLRNAVMTLRAS